MTQASLLTIHVDEPKRLVRLVRARVVLEGEGQIATMIAQARHALLDLDRAQYAILLDLRGATLADESKYEGPMVAFRREVTRDFRRVAILVETSVGRLQVLRFMREERFVASVFDGELSAMAFLTD